MRVSFKPNYKPSFQAEPMQTQRQVLTYMRGIKKSMDAEDLKKTIELTPSEVLKEALRIGAKNLGIKLD